MNEITEEGLNKEEIIRFFNSPDFAPIDKYNYVKQRCEDTEKKTTERIITLIKTLPKHKPHKSTSWYIDVEQLIKQLEAMT